MTVEEKKKVKIEAVAQEFMKSDKETKYFILGYMFRAQQERQKEKITA